MSYLYGPGKRDEHEDPRMVASWAPWVPDPARSGDVTIGDLALLLDAPVRALRGSVPAEHVYHVAVRVAPGDPLLTDEQWAEVAGEMMDAAGIAPRGDAWGCRWVAVRHADDHIHIVATKARQDGIQPNLRQDIVRMQQLARRFEVRWGLRRLASGDRTAKRWPTTGETRKATRRRRSESVRDQLERTVRVAAASAADEEDFFARLRSAGVRVARRAASGGGSPTGFAVALPGDRDRGHRAVWFGGSSLAYDLSLPRVRERWQEPVPTPDVPPSALWRTLERDVRAASERLGRTGAARGAGDVAALGDLLVVAPGAAPALARPHLRDSATAFERAARAPGRRDLDGQARTLFRSSARLLSSAAAQSGRNDAAAFLGFLLALVTAVAEAQRWHEEQGFGLQAEAAAKAGRVLREAAEVSTGAAAATGALPRARRAGSGAAESDRSVLRAAVVTKVLPAHASTVLVDPAWPALCLRLAALERLGVDAGSVLTAVVARRELRSAGSVAQVLVWRLDGWFAAHGVPLDSPSAAPAGAPPSRPNATSRRAAEAAPNLRSDQQGPRRVR
ncbi:relaxase/mobilization nuclease domain-containing protein [Kitasatospora sp. NPDC094028]